MQYQMLKDGSVLVDQSKIFNTLNRIITEIGLKEARRYFNDPTQPQDVLAAQVEQLTQQVQQLQAQVQNPIIESERIRAESQQNQEMMRQQFEQQKLLLTIEQQQKKLEQDYLTKLTELELRYKQNVPGALV
jgi:hypothetical protein